jgi:hypothetical protein
LSSSSSSSSSSPAVATFLSLFVRILEEDRLLSRPPPPSSFASRRRPWSRRDATAKSGGDVFAAAGVFCPRAVKARFERVAPPASSFSSREGVDPLVKREKTRPNCAFAEDIIEDGRSVLANDTGRGVNDMTTTTTMEIYIM